VLKRAWAVQDVVHGRVLITLPIDSAVDNNTVLSMDYRFDPPRWSQWPAVVAECLASVIDTTRDNRQTPYIGDASGFIRRTDTQNRSIDGITAIGYKVTLPFLDLANPVTMKTFARGGVGIDAKGNYNGTFSWSRDNRAQQTTTFSQAGGDVLAGSVTDFTVTDISNDNPHVAITTSSPHGLSVGDVIALKDSDPTVYNGVHTVTAVDSNTIFDILDPAGEQGFTPGTTTLSTTSTANFFALGTSTLGGARFVNRFFALEEGGEFRSIQFQVTQGGLNQDIDLHSIFAEVEPGADSTEND
jgi:hypothetical protein